MVSKAFPDALGKGFFEFKCLAEMCSILTTKVTLVLPIHGGMIVLRLSSKPLTLSIQICQ